MSDITIGIMGGFDVRYGTEIERRVYVEISGKLASYTPLGARKLAQQFRDSGIAELIELAGDLDALALEIEAAAGKS